MSFPAQSEAYNSELAYWLENLSRPDESILRLLVENYAADVYCLARACLAGKVALAHEPAWAVVERVFQQAVNDLTGLSKVSGVRAWLLGLALREVRRTTKWAFLKPNPPAIPLVASVAEEGQAGATPGGEGAQRLWARLECLSDGVRIAVILRFALLMPAQDIADLLKTDVREVLRRLSQARQKLRGVAHPPSGARADLAVRNPKVHSDIRQRLETAWFSLPGGDLLALTQLKTHLEECPACQDYAEDLKRAEFELTRALQNRWPAPLFSAERLDRLARQSLAPSTRQRRLDRLPPVVWEVALLGIVLLAALGLGWRQLSRDTHLGRPLFLPTLAPTPTALWLSTVQVESVPERLTASKGIPQEALYDSEADLSSDGRWMVYTSYMDRLVEGQVVSRSQVRLYDRLADQSIPVGPEPFTKNGDSSFHPSISADGRYVAFVSPAASLVPGGARMCQEGERAVNCAEIFVYDRQSGDIERISTSYDGSQARGQSDYPVISGDGRFVAYWSTAANLTHDPPPRCLDTDPARKCWDIFIADRQEGLILDREIPLHSHVLVGRQDQPFKPASLNRLSISSDGRILALSVCPDDLGFAYLDLGEACQAYVFDRLYGVYEPVSLRSDGTPGNLDSAYPELSADGTYVAFVSLASDLVYGDDNKRADVFVRDRQHWTTELVSVSSTGQQGNDHSGGYFGDNDSLARVAISADGRYVAFASNATNLEPQAVYTCVSSLGWACVNVFVHDRKTGLTQVAVDQPEIHALYSYPELSADGRWLALTHYDLECPHAPVCQVIYLRDRQTGNTLLTASPASLLTEDNQAGWTSVQTLNLSWGGIASLAFSPDSGLLAAGASDGGLYLWKVADGSQVGSFLDSALPLTRVAFSPDGNLLASASQDGKVRLYRVAGGRLSNELESESAPVLDLSFSPDGEMLTVGGSGTAWTWDMASSSVALLDYTRYPGLLVQGAQYSPDGWLVAHAITGASDHSIWLRKASDFSALARLSAGSSGLLSLAFSPASDLLAAGDQDGQVVLWKIERPLFGDPKIDRLLILQHFDWVSDLAFAPAVDRDGQSLLAVASLGGGVSLWKVPSGELLVSTLGGCWNHTISLAFSPDGKSLAIGSTWGEVQVWRKVANR